jgi:hypothetical protein
MNMGKAVLTVWFLINIALVFWRHIVLTAIVGFGNLFFGILILFGVFVGVFGNDQKVPTSPLAFLLPLSIILSGAFLVRRFETGCSDTLGRGFGLEHYFCDGCKTFLGYESYKLPRMCPRCGVVLIGIKEELHRH